MNKSEEPVDEKLLPAVQKAYDINHWILERRSSTVEVRPSRS